MERRLAFIIMFVLCFTLGIGACVIVYRSDERQMQTLAEKQPVATLSAPAEKSETIEETEEELPQPEELPQAEEPVEAAETEEIPEQPEEETVPAEPKYRFTVEPIASRLCVRKEPSLQAEILGFVYSNQSGEVLSLGEEWSLIKYEDLEGYSSMEYLILEELPQP